MRPEGEIPSAAPSTPTQGAEALQFKRLSWFLRTSLWVAAGLIVAAAGAFGAASAILPSCGSCHMVSEFKTNTDGSAHSNIDCARCHIRSDIGSQTDFLVHEVFGMALHAVPESGRAIAQVDDSTCLSCHVAINDKVSESNGLRIKHSQCATKTHCTDCHSMTAHGASVRWPRGVQMEMCLDCHVPNEVRGSCDTCHVAHQPSERLVSGTWQVTHGPSWRTAHGMGDWDTCAACHPAEKCVACHHIPLPHGEDFMRTHGGTAETHRPDCAVCHEDAFCVSCHGIQMPHPASFAATHGRTVLSKGQTVCLGCHVVADCETCHVKHIHPGGADLPPKAWP